MEWLCHYQSYLALCLVKFNSNKPKFACNCVLLLQKWGFCLFTFSLTVLILSLGLIYRIFWNFTFNLDFWFEFEVREWTDLASNNSWKHALFESIYSMLLSWICWTWILLGLPADMTCVWSHFATTGYLTRTIVRPCSLLKSEVIWAFWAIYSALAIVDLSALASSCCQIDSFCKRRFRIYHVAFRQLIKSELSFLFKTFSSIH